MTNRNKTDGSENKSPLQDLSTKVFSKMPSNLNSTLMVGMLAGSAAIIGYTLNLQEQGWKILFLFLILGSASYISGFFMGFLFGIPKRAADSSSTYNLSNNLVDISDWLTKIIIGLGLIEIKRIPGYLESIGIYIQNATGAESSVKIFSVCTILYFSVFGLYFGYNYIRLFLSGQYKGADDILLNNQQKLSEKQEELNKQDMSFSQEVDRSVKKTLDDYDQLLKSTKTEADYSFEDWYYKGVSAYNNKEYEKMVVYMQKALEKDPRSNFAPDAYLYLGLAYSELRLFEKAIEANNRIASDFKTYNYLHLAYYNNGVNYGNLTMYEKALEEYDKAIQVNPQYALSYNNKADTLIKLGRLDEAQDMLDKAISIDPVIPFPWYNKAIIGSLKHDKDSLIQNLKKAIELSPANKNYARSELNFRAFWEDPEFKTLVG